MDWRLPLASEFHPHTSALDIEPNYLWEMLMSDSLSAAQADLREAYFSGHLAYSHQARHGGLPPVSVVVARHPMPSGLCSLGDALSIHSPRRCVSFLAPGAPHVAGILSRASPPQTRLG